MANLKIASTTEIKIEKGVPLPAAHSAPGRPRFPLKELAVGDSFVVSGKDQDSIRSAASYTGIRLQRKFTLRKQPDGSIRVWRIA